MFVPFHADGIISQFEGYEDLEELDWDGLAGAHGNIQRLDRILRAEGDDPNRYKAAKQADAVMLFYLFPDAELRRLFAQLGVRPPARPGPQDHRVLRPADLPRVDAEPHRPCRRPGRHRRGELVGALPRRAAQRRRRRPGRHHPGGHPHGRDGRDAGPGPADLPRHRDPGRGRLLRAPAAGAARRAQPADAVPRHPDQGRDRREPSSLWRRCRRGSASPSGSASGTRSASSRAGEPVHVRPRMTGRSA